MYEDLSFEDTKRQFLQRPLIPESVVDDVQRVITLRKEGLISAETAKTYLEGIEADLRKLQGLVSSAEKTGEATELTLPLLEELEQKQELCAICSSGKRNPMQYHCITCKLPICWFHSRPKYEGHMCSLCSGGHAEHRKD